jgi:hypothetical protein
MNKQLHNFIIHHSVAENRQSKMLSAFGSTFVGNKYVRTRQHHHQSMEHHPKASKITCLEA